MSEPVWDVIIDAKQKHGRSSIKEILHYRDLLWLLVRRDFVAFYKQTILGPVWLFIQPLFTAGIYFFIFGNLAGLSTDGLPPALFYISGITAWTYFSETLVKTSGVLRDNAPIFGKVYFPRLVMPLSIIFSNMVKLAVQMILLIVATSYYLFSSDLISLSPFILLIPFIILVIAMQAVGIGLVVAAVATKYRDLALLLGFAMQILMFTAPVVYPFSSMHGVYQWLVAANPLTFAIEAFRFCFFGKGTLPLWGVLYMLASTFLILALGIFAFNKAEKTFVDTV